MSFGIRPTYKKRVLVNQQDDEIAESSSTFETTVNNNYVDTQKLVETVLQVSRRSGGLNTLSQQELENIIRKSSINPEHYPEMKENVNELIQSKKQENPNNLSSNPPVVHGFSNASNTSNTSTAFRDLLDQELRKELGKLDGNTMEDEVVEEKDDIDNIQEQNDAEEDEEEIQRRIENHRNKQMVANGFPSRASMLRGWEPRKTGTSGGIRKTASGMVDGF